MAEHAEIGARPLEPPASGPEPVRPAFETFALASIGVFALGAERVDELAEELAQRIGIDRDETRAVLVDVLESWRRELRRVGESSGSTASRLGAELGIASRDAVEELELRVAQLEHRLRLLERPAVPH